MPRYVRSLRTCLLATAVAAAACAAPTEAEKSLPSFEEFVRGVPYDATRDRYTVEGDIAMDGAQMREHYLRTIQRMSPRPAGDGDVQQTSQALAVRHIGGVDYRWNATEKMNLTYCIDRTSFGGNYDRAVTVMNLAVHEWERSAVVDFRHLSNHDGNCTNTNNGVFFNVVQRTPSGDASAVAFLPGYPRGNREIVVRASTVAGNSFIPIMMHELGHTLGFMHETARQGTSTTNCQRWEDADWRPISDKDDDSIMGCNVAATNLSDLDRIAAGCLYERPQGGRHQACESVGRLKFEGVSYRVHVQDIGWLPAVRNLDIAGTVGLGLRLEALAISLTGLASSDINICYNVHIAGSGWLPQDVCGSNIEVGTMGESRAIESVRFRLVNAPPNCRIFYDAHQQDHGWVGPVFDGIDAGKTGEGRRLEAIRVALTSQCMGPPPF